MARGAVATYRRLAWIEEHGPCAICGSSDNLEVDHIDPTTKSVPATVVWNWSWRREKERQEELAKCQVLCSDCHKKKTAQEKADNVQHGTLHMYNSPRYKCRCDLCVAAWAAYQRQYRDNKRRQQIKWAINSGRVSN